jgi:tape measure domain-containing protein
MALANLMARIRLEGVETAQRGLQQVRQGFHQAGEAAKSMGQHTTAAMRDMARGMIDVAQKATLLGGALAVAGGAAAFAVASKMDSLTRALAGSSANAEDLTAQITRLKEVARLPGLGFEEAIQGSVKLQAAGLSAQLAERSLKSFGNALALSGGGKDQLDGVITALGQISSKGTISAEEINQIAERVPQIRQLLSQAFGTSDTEKIQAMGLGSAEAIERIVAAAETLPKATGGFQNALENFQDGLKTAIKPLGDGIATAFASAGGPLQRFLDTLQNRLSQIGQVIGALGTSGVLGEVIDRLTAAFDGLLGNNLQERVAGFFANVASFIVNLPQTLSETGAYISSLFDAIGKNLVAAFEFAQVTIQATLIKVASGVAGISEALTQMMAFNPKGAVAALEGVTTAATTVDMISGYTMPEFTKLPEFNVRSLSADSERFKKMVMGSLGPMGGLPTDLIFGGGAKGQDSQAEGADPIERLLMAIEKNTKQAADGLSLRAQTLGGGQLAGLGVTPAELRMAGVSGFQPGQGDYLPRIPSNTLERAQRQIAREEARRLMGKGRIN